MSKMYFLILFLSFILLLILFLSFILSRFAMGCPTVDDLAVSIKDPAAELVECQKLASFNLSVRRSLIQVGVFGRRGVGSQVLETIQSSLDASASALAGLGDYSTAPIKVLIASESAEEFGAVSKEHVATTTVSYDTPTQCIIVVWLPFEEKELIEFAIAHEFFHCVQYHEFEQQAYINAGGDIPETSDPTWWIEGTAVWFASLTYPESNYTDNHNHDFRERFKGTETSLFEMSYENVVFFQWLFEKFGADRLFAFIQLLPKNRRESNKQAFNHAVTSAEFDLFLHSVGNTHHTKRE